MDWVNFREIRERIPIERVLTEYYQLDNLKVSSKVATGPCPVHGGNNPRGFHVDFEKNLWHCFTQCKKGGNQLDLVAAKDNVPVREAALRLKRFFLGDDSTPPPQDSSAHQAPSSRPEPSKATPASPPRKKEPVINPPLNLSLQLLADHPHIVEDRKLSLETAQHFGVGYCARGILAGCIGIPIHDDAGQLVAYAGRRLKFSDAEDLGKYRFPKGFHKDRVLFNLHRALPKADGALLLVEGFFSVLKLHDLGFPNVAAVMGSDLSEHQAVLAARAHRVLVLFDGNEAGRRGTASAVERLAPLTRVTAIDLPEGWEPEDCSTDLLQWLQHGATALDLASLSFRPQTQAAS
jgi:DNA primase